MNVTDNGAATAEPVATSEEAAPVAASAPAKTKKVAKTKKPAKKKAIKASMDDHEFHGQLLDNLYALRANTKVWVNLRNSTKEGENLHKLLAKQPVYKWRVVGISHYLEARHTGDDKVVAFILPINPRQEYAQAMRDYKKALDLQTKKSKPPQKPEKPADMKPCFQWHISARKGDDTEGVCMKFDEAVAAVMSRKSLFVV